MGRFFICALVLLSLVSGKALAQSGKPTPAELAALETHRIEAEMELMEREVSVYNKDIKQNGREYRRMKDKADRLKYKVARKMADVDTTKEHEMTYVEWKLLKAEQARDRAAGHVAKAEQSRQEKVIALGEKSKELHAAGRKRYDSADAADVPRNKEKDSRNKGNSQSDLK